MWHKHSWKVKSKKILPSFIEQVGKGQFAEDIITHELKQSRKNYKYIGEMETTSYSYLDPSHKPCICVFVCVKCQKERIERI